MTAHLNPMEIAPPSWRLRAREIGFILDPRRHARPTLVLDPEVGRGRPVLVIPGFLASDRSTLPLRQALSGAGFDVHGWARGRNHGLTETILEDIGDRVEEIAHGEPVALVGWSLGGLIAREFAKHAPDRVERVITLGSPIGGDPRRNNNSWRVYQLVAGHPVDAPPIDCVVGDKPGVQTIAIWSARDGIVSGASARADQSCDRSIEVGCGHIEMTFAPEAIRAVIDALG